MKLFYYIHKLLQIALLLQLVIFIGSEPNGTELDEQLKRMVNETLAKYHSPQNNAIGNIEFNRNLAKLREENESELLIYEYYEFEKYDERRMLLEEILMDFIEILDDDTSSENRSIYKKFKDKFRKALNMPNDVKQLIIEDAYEELKEYFDGNKDKDNGLEQFERDVLRVLKKYGIVGNTAKDIVDKLLADKKELDRLKEKLKDDDEDNDWSIWNDISELFGLDLGLI